MRAEHEFQENALSMVKMVGSGMSNEQDFIERYKREIGYTGSAKELTFELSNIFEPNLHNIAVLENLKQDSRYQGKIALLSDTVPMHQNFMKEVFPEITDGLDENALVYSYHQDIRTRKEWGREFFDRALERLNINSDNERCIMIDDREQNRVGAEQAGIEFVKIDENEDILPVLRNAGVEMGDAFMTRLKSNYHAIKLKYGDGDIIKANMPASPLTSRATSSSQKPKSGR